MCICFLITIRFFIFPEVPNSPLFVQFSHSVKRVSHESGKSRFGKSSRVLPSKRMRPSPGRVRSYRNHLFTSPPCQGIWARSGTLGTRLFFKKRGRQVTGTICFSPPPQPPKYSGTAGARAPPGNFRGLQKDFFKSLTTNSVHHRDMKSPAPVCIWYSSVLSFLAFWGESNYFWGGPFKFSQPSTIVKYRFFIKFCCVPPSFSHNAELSPTWTTSCEKSTYPQNCKYFALNGNLGGSDRGRGNTWAARLNSLRSIHPLIRLIVLWHKM